MCRCSCRGVDMHKYLFIHADPSRVHLSFPLAYDRIAIRLRAYEDKSLSKAVSTLMLTFRTPSVFILQNLIFPPVGLIQFLLRL